jgi:hypothetical protein
MKKSFSKQHSAFLPAQSGDRFAHMHDRDQFIYEAGSTMFVTKKAPGSIDACWNKLASVQKIKQIRYMMPINERRAVFAFFFCRLDQRDKSVLP